MDVIEWLSVLPSAFGIVDLEAAVGWDPAYDRVRRQSFGGVKGRS